MLTLNIVRQRDKSETFVSTFKTLGNTEIRTFASKLRRLENIEIKGTIYLKLLDHRETPIKREDFCSNVYKMGKHYNTREHLV